MCGQRSTRSPSTRHAAGFRRRRTKRAARCNNCRNQTQVRGTRKEASENERTSLLLCLSALICEYRMLRRSSPQVVASSRVQSELSAVEAAAAKATRDLGSGLLLHVYRTHPPPKPSLAISELESLAAAAGGAAAGTTSAAGRVDASVQHALKKRLLKAQRDFHPDRNADVVRGTLGYAPEEWEVLALSICQQLAHAYDRIHKGGRTLDENGGNTI